MAIFYLGPIILKHYRAKKKVQPIVPELSRTQMMNVPPKSKKVLAYDGNNTQVHVIDADKIESVPSIREVPPAWQGKLDQNMLVNGVMFAEILQPPRAYRPMVRHTK